MIRTTLTALLLLIAAAPVQASVYAVQQRDGSWKVSKYDDGDPKVSTTYRDIRKTIRVDDRVEEKDPTRRLTESGKAKQAAYDKAEKEWFESGVRVGATLETSVQRKVTNRFAYCGNGGCRHPKPGEWDRPAGPPEMKEGEDYTYGTRMVTRKIDKPNPNYGQLGEPDISFSDKAKKPGGAWLIGTTVQMSKDEFRNYKRYLF